MFPTRRTCSTGAAASGVWTAITRRSATSWSTTSESPVSFDAAQLLCGKCHGDKLRDWRDGIHGKRIGDWASTGKKRWFTCTECHNPHNVQDGERNRGFVQLAPESPPQLPKGMKDAKFEKIHPIPH
jgi:cytochrome c553